MSQTSTSDPTTSNSFRTLTFPLRWQRYALVYFLVIGTSISFFIGPFVLTMLLIPLFERLPDSWTWYYFGLIIGWWLIWSGSRLVRDFRTKITFTPFKIVLGAPRIQRPLPWLHITRIKQRTFMWADITHIELLPDRIAVQFPTVAVVLRTTPLQHTQFVMLAKTHLPSPQVMKTSQVY